MSSFSNDSANRPKIQFLSGFVIQDRVGKYKAPATAQDEGTLVKVSSDGATFELCGSNDAQFILEQPCAATGPIGSAANREKYLQGIVQRAVAVSTEITAYPVKSGGVIRTQKIVTGTATGAIDAATTVGTEVECYNGFWREKQGTNTAIGVTIDEYDATHDEIDILIF